MLGGNQEEWRAQNARESNTKAVTKQHPNWAPVISLYILYVFMSLPILLPMHQLPVCRPLIVTIVNVLPRFVAAYTRALFSVPLFFLYPYTQQLNTV